MPRLLARYPYLRTASGGVPIVWVGMVANGRRRALPAAPAPERMRTGLSPKAATSMDYSEAQSIELQFLSPADGHPIGRQITLVPELDHLLDEPNRVAAEGPWYRHPSMLLGQDCLENFWITLVGPAGVTALFEPDGAEEDDAR